MGPTLLVTALQAGFLEFIKPLLRHMRSTGLSDESVATCAGAAAFRTIRLGLPVACLEAFAEAGLDLKTAQGPTTDLRMVPLFHAACQYDRADAAAFLLEQGCDPKELNE